MAQQKLNTLNQNALILIRITRVYASCTYFSLTHTFENTLSQLVAHLQASFASSLSFFLSYHAAPQITFI